MLKYSKNQKTSILLVFQKLRYKPNIKFKVAINMANLNQDSLMKNHPRTLKWNNLTHLIVLSSVSPFHPFHLFYIIESIGLVILVKGALDNILKFSFWLNSIYHVNIDC